MWLPNQRRISFHWVFQVALRKLVPLDVLERVRLVMCDQDEQQGKEVDSAIREYMTNAVRGFCAWHFIFQKWKAVGLMNPKLFKIEKENYDILQHRIHTWMYSWMRPGYCEDEDEFEVSKYMLYAFLRSDTESMNWWQN